MIEFITHKQLFKIKPINEDLVEIFTDYLQQLRRILSGPQSFTCRSLQKTVDAGLRSVIVVEAERRAASDQRRLVAHGSFWFIFCQAYIVNIYLSHLFPQKLGGFLFFFYYFVLTYRCLFISSKLKKKKIYTLTISQNLHLH